MRIATLLTFGALVIFGIAAGSTSSYASNLDSGRLQVTVSDVHSSRGHIRVAVCTAATFLGPNCPYHGSALATSGSVAVNVDGVPPGTYAVQVFQDEDDSLQIKRTLFGLPEEGIGFSNDVAIVFGPPRFTDAAVRVTAQGRVIGLRLRYF